MSFATVILKGAFGQLTPVVVALLRSTLLQPYLFGSAVWTAWTTARDVALAGLGCVLAYGAIRLMVVGGRAWDLVARGLLAALAAQFSFTGVSLLLRVNNALVTAFSGPAASGVERLIALPLGALVGASAGIIPAVIGLVVALGALWLVLTYFLRTAEIVLLTLLAPFAAIVWTIPTATGVWTALVAELVSAIFLQAGQALLLWGLLAVTVPSGAPARLVDLFTALAALMLLGRVRGLLRGLCRAPLAAEAGAAPWVVMARLASSLRGAPPLAGG